MRAVSPSRGFMLLYALLVAGAFTSFMPFVMVLLPLKIDAIDPGNRVTWLSAAAIGGAAVASVANIAFGALSDRSHRLRGHRRRWIVAGMGAVTIAYAGLLAADTGWTMLAAVAGLQIAFNMIFAPIGAIMADEVPDTMKGLVAGLIGLAHPLGSLMATVVTLPAVGGPAGQYAVTCALVGAMIAPYLLLARETGAAGNAPPSARDISLQRGDFALIWAARLCMQVAGNAITNYGFYYFLDLIGVDGAPDAVSVSSIVTAMSIATVLAMLFTVAAGRLSDRIMRRKPFLVGSALLIVAGLALMALGGSWQLGVLGYWLVAIGNSIFLALQSALAMQLLPSPEHRGRDLGVLNLTNTLPAMVAPLIVLALPPGTMGYAPLWLTFAAAVLIGGLAALAVRSRA